MGKLMDPGASGPSKDGTAGSRMGGRPVAERFFRAPLLAYLGLAVATFLALSPLLGADFINYDDPMFVTENAHVQAGLTWEGLRWAFTTLHMGFYYPLTLISHMLDCQIFGLNAWGHHLTSLLIHVANALLLMVVLRRATGALWPSTLVAALFALHPLHAESVAWIAERKDVLSTFFLMLTLLAYAAYAKRPSPGRYASVLGLFLCSLLSKAMTVTAPFLMLLMDYWPLERMGVGSAWVSGESGAPKEKRAVLSPWRLIAEKVPFILLSTIFVAITVVAQHGAITPLERVPLLMRCQNALISYAGYLAKLFAPANLAIFYPFHIQAVTLPRAALAATLLLLVTVLAWRLRRSHPYVLVGWLWYLGALVPVIGILQVGGQSSADRYTYVPSIGIFIILAWAVAQIPLRTAKAKMAATAGAMLVMVALSAATWVQARTWHDSVTLFGHAAKVTRDNYLAHTMLGVALQKKGDLRGASDQFKEAVRLAPDDVDAWGDLGNLFERQGKPQEAASCYERVIVLSPKDDRAYNNLGMVREGQGRLPEAERCFAKAAALKPSMAAYSIQLGRIQAQEGHDQEARRSFEHAAASDSRSGKPWYYLGLLDLRAGQIPQAEANLRKAEVLTPAEELVHLKLGEILERQKRLDEAEVEYREALRRSSREGEAWLGLARIAAARGRSGEAREDEARAKQLSEETQSPAQGALPK